MSQIALIFLQSRIDKLNLVLRHSVPHFPPIFRDCVLSDRSERRAIKIIAFYVINCAAALRLTRSIINYFLQNALAK